MLMGMSKIATTDILSELGRSIKEVAVHLMRRVLTKRQIKVVCNFRVHWETIEDLMSSSIPIAVATEPIFAQADKGSL